MGQGRHARPEHAGPGEARRQFEARRDEQAVGGLSPQPQSEDRAVSERDLVTRRPDVSAKRRLVRQVD